MNMIRQQYTFTINNYQQLDDIVLYEICITDCISKDKWTYKTRFSDLRDFRQLIVQYRILLNYKNKKQQYNFVFPEFPKRQIWGITNENVDKIEERKKGLETYLNQLFK